MTAKWDKIIEKASRLHRVPFALLKAQVGAESSFNEKAVSYKKDGTPLARGASQFVEKTGNKYGLSSANSQPRRARSFQPRRVGQVGDGQVYQENLKAIWYRKPAWGGSNGKSRSREGSS